MVRNFHPIVRTIANKWDQMIDSPFIIGDELRILLIIFNKFYTVLTIRAVGKISKL